MTEAEKTRLQAALDYATARAIREDEQHREQIRKEMQLLRQNALAQYLLY